MEDQTTKTEITKYIEAVKAITKEQSKIVGESVALELAQSTEGLTIDKQFNISIEGDPVKVLSNLVERYSLLFGKISIEVSKDAVDDLKIFTDQELPVNLR